MLTRNHQLVLQPFAIIERRFVFEDNTSTASYTLIRDLFLHRCIYVRFEKQAMCCFSSTWWDIVSHTVGVFCSAIQLIVFWNLKRLWLPKCPYFTRITTSCCEQTCRRASCRHSNLSQTNLRRTNWPQSKLSRTYVLRNLSRSCYERCFFANRRANLSRK